MVKCLECLYPRPLEDSPTLCWCRSKSLRRPKSLDEDHACDRFIQATADERRLYAVLAGRERRRFTLKKKREYDPIMFAASKEYRKRFRQLMKHQRAECEELIKDIARKYKLGIVTPRVLSELSSGIRQD